MPKVLVLGGTRGLGLELAKIAKFTGQEPLVFGRKWKYENPKIMFRQFDFTQDLAISRRIVYELSVRHLLINITHVFWVAGIYLCRPFVQVDEAEELKMTQVHLLGPLSFLRLFINRYQKPFHLVTVASTASWRLGKNEAIYRALKAAKAQFTRQLAYELPTGSKTTVVNVDGMKTDCFKEAGVKKDTSQFLDPAAVAECIWTEIAKQEAVLDELQIERLPGGNFALSHGTRAAQLEFDF